MMQINRLTATANIFPAMETLSGRIPICVPFAGEFFNSHLKVKVYFLNKVKD
jgi:hypothetical protein